MLSRSPRIFLLSLIPLFAMIIGFQNCSKTPEGGGGNGDSYGGIGAQVPAGAYYARKNGFECTTGSSGLAYPGVTHIIKVMGTSDTIEKIDNCTGTKTHITRKDLELNSVGADYFAHQNEVYAKSDSPPDPNAPVPVLVCATENPMEEAPVTRQILGVQHVLIADYSNHVLAVVRGFAEFDPKSGSVVPGFMGPVSLMTGAAELPAGVASTSFVNIGTYFLNVSSLMDSQSGFHPAEFRGLIDTQMVAGPTRCIQPNFTPP